MYCNACGRAHGMGALVERDLDGHMMLAGFRLEELTGLATVVLGFVALYNVLAPRKR